MCFLLPPNNNLLLERDLVTRGENTRVRTTCNLSHAAPKHFCWPCWESRSLIRNLQELIIFSCQYNKKSKISCKVHLSYKKRSVHGSYSEFLNIWFMCVCLFKGWLSYMRDLQEIIIFKKAFRKSRKAWDRRAGYKDEISSVKWHPLRRERSIYRKKKDRMSISSIT